MFYFWDCDRDRFGRAACPRSASRVLGSASHVKGDRLDTRAIEESCDDWPYITPACATLGEGLASWRGAITGKKSFLALDDDWPQPGVITVQPGPLIT